MKSKMHLNLQVLPKLLLLYLLIGLIWIIVFNALLLGTSLAKVLVGMVSPEGIVLILIWPMQLAQYFGLFGLSFN